MMPAIEGEADGRRMRPAPPRPAGHAGRRMLALGLDRHRNVDGWSHLVPQGQNHQGLDEANYVVSSGGRTLVGCEAVISAATQKKDNEEPPARQPPSIPKAARNTFISTTWTAFD
jgi:hypothetical protein